VSDPSPLLLKCHGYWIKLFPAE